MLDLHKKLDKEKKQNIESAKRIEDLQVELDCTKDSLKFVQEESQKNKVCLSITRIISFSGSSRKNDNARTESDRNAKKIR
jgi:hypothetical protein